MAVGGEDIRTEPERGAQRGVGAVLRDRRVELALELDDVADALRIRRAYLAAIENGRLDDLPGHIYAVGFIRTYSGYLGFDSEQVLERFKQEAALSPQPVRLNFPPPPPESRAPKTWMILLGLALAAAIYGAWQYRQRIEFPLADLPPPVATPPAPVVSTPPPPAPPVASSAPSVPPAVPPAAPAVPPAPEATPAAPPAAVSPSAPPPTAAGTPPSAPSAPAAPMPTGRSVDVAALPPAGGAQPSAPAAAPQPATPAGARVVIRATADSWLTVTASNNEVLVPGRVLRPGDTLRLPDRADALLWTGNLGGLEVLVDDKPVPRLGNPGEAKRNVSLDPARLLGGTAVPR